MNTSTLHQYKCTFAGCQKFFPSNGLLKRHMRIHTGEKPYACVVCGKCFSQRGNLSKHLLSHENAHLRWNRETSFKPHKCPVAGCGRSFTAKLNLRNHIATAHAEDNVQNESPTTVSPPTACLHTGCTLTFHSDSELREHIFKAIPGVVEEFNFLRETALKFASAIGSWEALSESEKVSMRLFAQSAVRAIGAIPAASASAYPAQDHCPAPTLQSTVPSAAAACSSNAHISYLPTQGAAGFSGNMMSAHGGDFRHAAAVCAPCHAGVVGGDRDDESGRWSDLDSVFDDLAGDQGLTDGADLYQQVGAESDTAMACSSLALAQDRIASSWERHVVMPAQPEAHVESNESHVSILCPSSAWDADPDLSGGSSLVPSPPGTGLPLPVLLRPSCVGRSGMTLETGLSEGPESRSPEVFSFLKRTSSCCETHSRSARGGV